MTDTVTTKCIKSCVQGPETENSHENNMRVGNGNAHLIRWYDHAANRGHRTGAIHINGVKFLPKKKRKE